MSDRPQSRGFNTSSGGFRSTPPPSHVGSYTSTPNRPTSAMRSTGGSSGGRPTSQRGSILTGTALSSRAGLNSSLVAAGATPRASMESVQVMDRPVTQQGLSGMRTSQTRSGRQVQDKSYFKAQLRNRINALSSEIALFNKEMTEIARESQSYKQYQRRRQLLLEEVKGLEGELADYNLTLDKQRANIRSDELERQYMSVKEKNVFGKQQIDEVFLQKKEREEDLATLEHALFEQQSYLEGLVARLIPEQKKEYEKLIAEQVKLRDASHELEAAMEPLQQRLAASSDRLDRDPSRRRMLALSKARDNILQRRMEVSNELEKISLPLPKQKEILMEKIKEENRQMAELETTYENIGEALERLRRNAAEISAALNGSSNEQDAVDSSTAEQQQKYKLLFSKDAEMTTFLKKFSKNEQDERSSIKALEENIKNIMMEIHRALGRAKEVPSRARFEEMQEDLEFKDRQIEASGNTGQRLEIEVRQRREELQKISELEQKVEDELAQAEESIQSFQIEIDNRFSCVDDLKEIRMRDMQTLAERKQKLERGLPALRDSVASLQLRLDDRKQALGDNQGHAALLKLEGSLKESAHTKYTLEASLKMKIQESAYEDENTNAMMMVNKINEIAKRKVHFVMPPGYTM